jgi:hypothetical protein
LSVNGHGELRLENLRVRFHSDNGRLSFAGHNVCTTRPEPSMGV